MDNLSIVTSCTGYGKYLEEWAAAITRLEQRPALVGIITHGTPADEKAGADAAGVLRSAGFHVTHQHAAARLDFGVARNRAVALSTTEWVMHLDCDDQIMPHALGDFARLAGKCDIIAAGYERSGDLRAGPSNRTRLYRSSPNGAAVLASAAPCSGVSPFRRSFWERSPYRTDMVGGWDTALWIGFGHLGARILPTTRPVFWYRQHADSVFNVRRKGGFAAARTGATLRALRRGWSGVTVVIPWAPSSRERTAALAWVKAHYAAHHPGWQVRIGEAPKGSWRKGAAVQAGLTDATGYILVIADADCLVDPESLRHAVRLVETGQAPWVVPHTKVHRLSTVQTSQWLMSDPKTTAIRPPPGTLQRPAYEGFAGGGIVVCHHPVYEACGGIPIDFSGWGGEDEALGKILDTLCGLHRRLPGDLIHLWHPPQSGRMGRNGVQERQNRGRLAVVKELAKHPDVLYSALTGGALQRNIPYWTATDRYRNLAARGAATREALMDQRPKTGTGDPFAEARLARRATEEADRKARAEARRAEFQAAEAVAQAKRAARRGYVIPATPHLVAKMGPATAVENKMGPVATVQDKAEPVAETRHKWDGEVSFPPADEGNDTAVFVADAETDAPTYASERAAEVAEELGVTPEQLAEVTPGPRGYTVAQVRQAAGV